MCDASLVVMRHAPDGSVLDVGRKTRTISPAIRRALTVRDAHCRFPACTGRYTDAHHIAHWADGGATRLDNLVLLCRRHHRAVHEEGWTVTPETDGEVRFTRPKDPGAPDARFPARWGGNGVRLEAAPAAPRWRETTWSRGVGYACPLAPTTERLASAGIVIGPRTGWPQWYGEPFDAGYALDVLRQDEERERRVRYAAKVASTASLSG